LINIIENYSNKVVGQTSLFISFDYDPKIVEIMKMAGDGVYNNKTKIWEFPLNKLSFLIDNLTMIDNINLDFLPENQYKDTLDLTLKNKTVPYPYQLDGIKWLINNPNGLLLDCPGLGKTIQVIYAAAELKAQKDIKHCLIICGINTLKVNWKKEIEKHSDLDCVIIGEKINSRGRVTYLPIKDRAEQLYQPIKEFFVIINVESLRDSLVVDAIRNSKNSFDMIVVDEIHKMKSATTSIQGKNLLKLSKVGKYHYGLTGTILTNSPLDAFVPLKFIGYERSTYTNFKNFFCEIEYKFGHQQIVGFRNMNILKNEIAECSLRRNKELLNLPPKVIIPEYIELDEAQQKFYNNIQKGVVEEADRVNIKSTSLLGLITRLRQAATCPSSLSTSILSNSKIERAVDLIDEILSNNEKVIIFSTFKEPLNLLKVLTKQYKPLLCTGDQTDEEINKNIELFQTDPDYKIILCTTSKMGTGITLTAASYEIFIDSSWTSADEEQCEDRAHRIGTQKSVIIYKLIAKNTIDERIQKLLNQKRGISDYLVDNKYNQDEELRELLGI